MSAQHLELTDEPMRTAAEVLKAATVPGVHLLDGKCAQCGLEHLPGREPRHVFEPLREQMVGVSAWTRDAPSKVQPDLVRFSSEETNIHGRFGSSVEFDPKFCAWGSSVYHYDDPIFFGYSASRSEAMKACADAIDAFTKLVP